LLTDHIFGIDTDADARQLAELSLIMTLLDYEDAGSARKYGTLL
jgi:hypothetical protein